MLVVLEGGRLAAVGRLPAAGGYAHLAGAADTDGDGVAELLLESGAYTMGQLTTTLDLVALAGDGTATVRRRLGEVYYDGCKAPSPPRERRAAAVVLKGRDLVVQRKQLRCG